MKYKLYRFQRHLCKTMDCVDLSCVNCHLATAETFQVYIDSLIHNNVISHEDMLLIEDKSDE